MRKISEKLKNKTQREMIKYIIVSGVIFFIVFLFMFLMLDAKALSTIVISIICCIVYIAVELYLGWHLVRVALREDEMKREEERN